MPVTRCIVAEIDNVDLLLARRNDEICIVKLVIVAAEHDAIGRQAFFRPRQLHHAALTGWNINGSLR